MTAASDQVLVTTYAYDSGGRLRDTTDRRGIVTRTEYDLRGRVARTIEAYADGTPSSADDRITEWTYNGNSDILTMKAVLPNSAFQQTKYIYGVSQGSEASNIDSNDLLGAVQYPDKTTGAASSGEQETLTVNALGEHKSFTDRNGTTHAYAYDVLGRVLFDEVTTLGSGVDDAIVKLGYTFDSAGRPFRFTSFDDQDEVVNQVQRDYNGLGQLLAEWQEHDGEVDASSVKVQYVYSEMGGGANHSRLLTVVYPNGRELNYAYGASASLNDRISRLNALVDDDGTTTLEGYAYLGHGIVVERSHPEADLDLTYIGTGPADGGDQYVGLDRFGRIIDQRWTNGSSDIDRFGYGYDRASNRLHKENKVEGTMSELYTYDALNRLTGFDRGTLNGTKTGLTGSASRSQDWTLDALGNASSITTDGVQENRTYNGQNQLTQMGSNTLGFDENGNTITDQNGKTFIYDAWHRLVEVKDGSTSLIRYEHNRLGRRVQEGSKSLYHSADWQVLEERSGGTTDTQYVWSPVYVDALVERDRDTDSNGSLDERLYVAHDASFNVTAIVTTSAAVSERYTYDSYGKQKVLDANWSADADGITDLVFRHGHQGGKVDAVTGKMHFRNRDYDVDTMRWMQQDPTGYVDGANLYLAVNANPLVWTDASGLKSRAGIAPPHVILVPKVTDSGLKIYVLGPAATTAGHVSGQGTDLRGIVEQIKHIAHSAGKDGKPALISEITFYGHGTNANDPWREMQIASGGYVRLEWRIGPDGKPIQDSLANVGKLGQDKETLELTPATKQFWKEVDPLMTKDCKIYFFGCNTGRGPAGEKMLTDIMGETCNPVVGYDSYVGLGGIRWPWARPVEVSPPKDR